ncbi:MAG: molybdenum ABC transporter ATP-binding protein [Sneathiellaceae bacterium]
MTLQVALRHGFPGFDLDVAFDCPGSGVTALFGPSGAGKSSTVQAIAGLLRPREGRIVLEGEVLLDTETGAFLPPQRRRIGYVFQDLRLFPHLSVQGNLLFGWRRTGRRLGRAEIDRLVELLGIGHLLHRRPRALSGGERQRVALGRALLADPRLLLLDEPRAGLDQARKEELLPYLERLRDERRVPILLVSHALTEVARLADSLVVMQQGRVLASGSLFDLLARPDLAPLAAGPDAGAVLQARVTAHDTAHALTELQLDGGARLLVPALPAAPGASVRLRILARDVTLALDPPQRISANNVLPASILDLRPGAGPEMDVALAVGDARLLARITRLSAARLALAPGLAVHAIVKSVTVDRAGF